MRKLLFVLMMLAGLVGCKKDDGPEALPEIASLVGRWKTAAYENVVDGAKVWVAVSGEASYLNFRYDGVILDSKGLPACCAPGAYYLNGVLFKVDPKEAVPKNPQCALVDCIGCDTWSMEQTGNELILSICNPNGLRAKYVRD